MTRGDEFKMYPPGLVAEEGKPFYWLKDLTTEVYPHEQVFLSACEIIHNLYLYVEEVFKRSTSDFDKQAILCQINILEYAVRKGGKISVAEYAKLWPEYKEMVTGFPDAYGF